MKLHQSLIVVSCYRTYRSRQTVSTNIQLTRSEFDIKLKTAHVNSPTFDFAILSFPVTATIKYEGYSLLICDQLELSEAHAILWQQQHTS